jgi:hypothetical protein
MSKSHGGACTTLHPAAGAPAYSLIGTQSCMTTIPYVYTKYNGNMWQIIFIQRFELFYTELFICKMVFNYKRTAEMLS